VREGASLAAEDALALGVIDYLSASTRELLQTLHGASISLTDGERVIATEGLALYRHPMDWRSEFLAVITNPNIAYILMLLGIYGLIIEFYNPGIGLPGVVGAVSLLVALYAFQVLPISYVGLALLLLGIGLMTAEAFAPSFGVLGLGGIVAFIVGSVMLMDTDLPGYQIALPMILAFAVFTAGLLVIGLALIMRARKRTLVSGMEHLVGVTAEVETLRGSVPMVRLDGELWQAQCPQLLAPADRVRVESVEGVTLRVTKISGEHQ
jgi:membrane-bound serine protease (ClpP class)